MNTNWRRFVAPLLLALPCAAAGAAPLPVLGPAPAFALESSQGSRVTLAELRGKVLVVTFVFTTCSDSCPIITAKLAEVARGLGHGFDARYTFVAISVDPLNDTPARLRDYARAHGVDMPGWFFLTGAPANISAAVRHYGAYAKKIDGGSIEHLFLTSLVDSAGMLRVQYLGTHFDPREMLRDLQSLANE